MKSQTKPKDNPKDLPKDLQKEIYLLKIIIRLSSSTDIWGWKTDNARFLIISKTMVFYWL